MKAKINHDGRKYQVNYEIEHYVDGKTVHKLTFSGKEITGKTLDVVVNKFREIIKDERSRK